MAVAASYKLSSVEIPSDPPERLLHVSFNQDGGCFAAGTTSGFRVYNCDPFSELICRDLGDSWRNNNVAAGDDGAGAVEMLFRTNLVALILGGGGNPTASKVVIWDDHQRRCIGGARPAGGGSGLLRGVRLARDYVVAITDSTVFVYAFADMTLLHRYETAPNPRGLCALTPLGLGDLGGSRVLLACPGPREGQVRVERLHLETGDTRRTVLVDPRPASAVACLALSRDGRLLATAGAGCADVVRVFDAADGKLLRQVSLASAAAASSTEVCSLAFSGDARFLAAAGDGGEVQVFGLRAEEDGRYGAASRFRAGDGGERCIVAFGAQGDTVMVVGMDGSFCHCRFDPVHGGEMELLERHNFMSPSGLST